MIGCGELWLDGNYERAKFSECTLVYWYNNDSVWKWISSYSFYKLSRGRCFFLLLYLMSSSVSALSSGCPDVAREHSLKACCVCQERIVIPPDSWRRVHTGFGWVTVSYFTPQAVRAHSKLLHCHKWALVYTAQTSTSSQHKHNFWRIDAGAICNCAIWRMQS